MPKHLELPTVPVSHLEGEPEEASKAAPDAVDGRHAGALELIQYQTNGCPESQQTHEWDTGD
eukprot:9126493-Pyramimonas_sp.AAC.2